MMTVEDSLLVVRPCQETGKGIVLGAGALFEWGSELALWAHWLECSVCRRSRLSAASRSLVSAVKVAALCWPLYLDTHVCRSGGRLLALCHCFVWGRSPPETPARGRVSFLVSRLRHLPMRSLVLLSHPPGDRGICESKPPGRGTPPGCPVVVPVLGAALHLPSAAVWRPGPPGPAAQGLLGERRRRLCLGHVLPQVAWEIKGESGRCWVLF